MKRPGLKHLFVAIAIGMGSAIVMPATPASALMLEPNQETVMVGTAQELMNAIGSNRKIVLKPGRYEISAAMRGSNPHLKLDGELLYIDGVENLTIQGQSPSNTQVVIANTLSAVLNFRNCRGITLDSIEMGHVPQSHAICLGAVVLFLNSSQIHLNQMVLFGSGAFGLWVEQSHHLKFENSVVKQCSQGLMFLSDSRYLSFEKSMFIGNNGGVNLDGHSHDIRFSGSEFRNNVARANMDYVRYLFGGYNGASLEGVSVENCLITGNQLAGMTNSRDGLAMSGNRVEGNSW